MELGSSTVTTRARPHSVCSRYQEIICLNKSSQSLSPVYSSPTAGSCQENRNSVTRSSRNPKMHGKGPDTTQPSSSLFASSPSSSSIEWRMNNNSIHQSKTYQRIEESLIKLGLPLLRNFLFIDAEAELPQFKTFASAKMILNPRFFSMSDQPDCIQSYHIISSIMKSRFESLIPQLSFVVSKEIPEC